MTEEEFIKQAQLDWEDYTINNLKDALEACYGNGSYDDISGDVESPTGHFYRIDRWIVVSDESGNHTIYAYLSEREAIDAFKGMEDEYGKWGNN